MGTQHYRAQQPVVVLMADDSLFHAMMVQSAFEQSGLSVDLRYVEDGEKAMDYLMRRCVYQDPVDSPRPDLILLDVVMPGKDGIEALREIKGTPELCSIPTAMLTSPEDEKKGPLGCSFGPSSFAIKPISLDELVEEVEPLCPYWFKIVSLPEIDSIEDFSPPRLEESFYNIPETAFQHNRKDFIQGVQGSI